MMKANRTVFPALVTGIILSGLLTAQPLLAATVTPGSGQAKEVTKDAVAAAKQAADEKKAKYSKEAADAIKAVEEAIALLEKGKNDEAIKKLETASGKLEIAMAADSSLVLVPVATDVFTFELVTSPETVKADLDVVDDLIDAGDVQGARVLLNGLRSEIVTETTYLPLESYPGAINRAVKEITSDQTEQAMNTLIIARDSLIEETVITPLPMVLAHSAIRDAEQAQKTDRDMALLDLDYASGQIETARLLGYFIKDKAEYEEINKNIENIRHEIKGKSRTEKLFDDTKNALNKLLDKFSVRNASAPAGKSK